MSNVSIYPNIDNIWPYLLLIALLEILSVYFYLFRKIPGAIPLCCSQIAKAVLVLSFVRCGTVTSRPEQMFWVCMYQCMLVLLIFFWAEFVFDISQPKVSVPDSVRSGIRWAVAGLLLIVSISNIFGGYWKDVFHQNHLLKLTFGPVAWATLGFCYLLFLFCIWISVRWTLTVHGLRRRQAIMLTISPLITMVGNVLQRVPPLAAVSPQMLALLAAGLYMAWVFYRWRIYSILPLALDTVTRTMADGLLVADEKGFIVGMNLTARELFKNSEIMIDDTLEKLFTAWSALGGLDNHPGARHIEMEREFSGVRRHFRVEMIPLVMDGKNFLGKAFVLKDITLQKQNQAKMVEQQMALAILTERDRFGRDLHDTLGQFPGYIKTQAQAVRLLMEKQRFAEVFSQLDRLIQAADAAFDDARESIAGLKLVNKDWDFFDSLRAWLNRFQEISGIIVDYRGPDKMPERWIVSEAEVHLLRIVQEALTNVRKHANAGRVEIDTACAGDTLIVEIADNGCGFGDGPDTSTGFGLGIIQERVTEVGGTCNIESTPGRGTRIEVRVPLRQEDRVKGENL